MKRSPATPDSIQHALPEQLRQQATSAPPADLAVVTPVRDEELNLPRLSRSMALQTSLPALWIIVDDGSSDSTRRFAELLPERLPWAQVINRHEPGGAHRGGRTVRSFLAGVAHVPPSIRYIAKLDADVSIPPEYFRRLVSELEQD